MKKKNKKKIKKVKKSKVALSAQQSKSYGQNDYDANAEAI